MDLVDATWVVCGTMFASVKINGDAEKKNLLHFDLLLLVYVDIKMVDRATSR